MHEKSINRFALVLELEEPNGTSRSFRKKPTLIAASLLLVVCVLNDVALAWIHERVPRGHNGQPLPDLWFSIFPEIPQTIVVSEVILLLLSCATLLLVLLHQHRWITVRRLFLIAAICYASRAICITVVQVPVPSQNTFCAEKANESSFALVFRRVIGTLSGLGMDLYRRRVLCGDLILSGHTVTLLLSHLTISHYAPRRFASILSVICACLVLIALICILLSRKHYLIDVILGYYLTTRVFWTYHSLLSDSQSPLNAVWWSSLLRYFESDAPPPSLWHNRLQLPSICP